MRRVVATTLALTAALVTGCGLVTGAGDLQEVACPSGATCADAEPVSDATTTDGAAGEGGHDAGADGLADVGPPDIGPLDSGTCGAKAVCIPSLPQGWTPVVLNDNQETACPIGYQGPTDTFEGPSAPPATCAACACMVTNAGTCLTGTVSILLGTAVICAADPTKTFAGNGGACTSMVTSVPSGARGAGTAPPASGTTCGASSTKTAAPPTFSAQGVYCSPAGAPTACGAGGVCLPVPAPPFQVCLMTSGMAVCPSALPNGHVVGTGWTDGRACTGCGCSPIGNCTNATLALFKGASCSGNSEILALNGTCTQLAAGDYPSYEYAATIDSTCQPQGTAMATGSVSLTGVSTVCCP